MTDAASPDARPPREIASLVEGLGVAKSRLDPVTLGVLAVLAGAFISLGAMLYLVVVTGSTLGFGVTRLLGGLAFCLGLVLVIVAGAELFTGNNLLAMAWASGLVDSRAVGRNWLIAYVGNVIGCLGTVALVHLSGLQGLGGGAVGATALQVAAAKAALPWDQAFARGVLCNALVCLAVWLTQGGHTVTDRILGIAFPITAFVALGGEHSIANWFLLPYGMLLDTAGSLSAGDVARNLVAVTAGNIVGGTLLVAGVYWLAYLRGGRPAR
ncbi:formate/nitrite transporter family protein [Ideonella sp. A 288]|uniref:formate/nitrite transporter family protein n=1 Tax=Ideonella sp. A 288 TaxID=1962181 RepID=UPI000B4B2523|nr:formate/nitrite transporter family protein [Ideonella sp. A 288]